MVDLEKVQQLIYFWIRMRVRSILFVVLVLVVQVIGGFGEMVDVDLMKHILCFLIKDE